jgi:hypothetical protein
MIVSAGEKLHIIMRQMFERDVRRHFIAEVVSCEGALVRVKGYVFVYEPDRGQFTRRPDTRVRIVNLADPLQIVKVLPDSLLLEDLVYRLEEDGSVVVTDNRNFKMDINEFLPR